MLRGKSDPFLAVVPKVDAKRYQGTWYEIARLPAWFERSCVSNVTASYTLRHDGRIEVLNACHEANGNRKLSKGIASVKVKAGPNSKLKVRFFGPFSGDYWILSLDSAYRWAVVGTPNRKYLWILSRTPTLSRHVYDQLVAKGSDLGFNVSRLQLTTQNH